MTTYIWQHPDWPNWRYDITRLAAPLGRFGMRKAACWVAWNRWASNYGMKPGCKH